MKPRIAVVLVLILGLGLFVVACGGGGSGSTQTISPTPTTASPTPSVQPPPTGTEPAVTASASEQKAVNEAKDFFDNPPNFSIELSDKTLSDPEVPSTDVQIPQTQPSGNLDMNLNMDLKVNPTIPSINLPNTSGLIDMPTVGIPSMPSTIPTSTPGGASIPTPGPSATPGGQSGPDCSMFATVPSCSYVPAQFQQLCEQCKAQGN